LNLDATPALGIDASHVTRFRVKMTGDAPHSIPVKFRAESVWMMEFMRRSVEMRRRAALFVLLVFLSAGATRPGPGLPVGPSAGSGDPPALVLLVRHGEKASRQGEDPALTAAGERRARALAETLQSAGVTDIVTTQLRRTRDTAQPLADELHIRPEIVPVSVQWEGIEEHAKAVAAAVRRHPGGVVLVVGHQNTVPAIIEALGGPHLPDIRDSVFDDLFVLLPGPGQARLVRSRYGEPSTGR
jgi:phosphohistidine phosphatase SixA